MSLASCWRAGRVLSVCLNTLSQRSALWLFAVFLYFPRNTWILSIRGEHAATSQQRPASAACAGNSEYAKVFEAQGRRTAGANEPVTENGHLDADALEHFVNVKMLRVINWPDIVPKVTPKDFSNISRDVLHRAVQSMVWAARWYGLLALLKCCSAPAM